MQTDVKESKFTKKKVIDKILQSILLITALISASIIILIIWQIAVRGMRPLFGTYIVEGNSASISFFKFITGTSYTAPFYRIGFVIINTLFIVFLTILIATPIGVLTALFIVKVAPKALSKIMNTIIEMLAAVPSVIFAMFGFGFTSKIVQSIASVFGNSIGLHSLLNTIFILAMMVLPTITTMSVTALKSVSKDIEHGSLALGASKSQTMYKVSLVAAKSGIFAGVILAVGRALGEATVVSMLSGNAQLGPTFSLFKETSTLTSIILMGLKETEGFDYDSRFTIGLVLIGIILFSNYILNLMKKRIGNYEA